MENQTIERPVHVGRNIQKIRLIRGINQTGMAAELEKRMHRPYSQQFISDIEEKEKIEDDELLKQIAEILQVSPEALKNLDFEDALNVFGNTFNNNANSTGNLNLPIYHKSTIHQTYNPLEKLIEFFKDEKSQMQTKIDELAKENEKLKKSKKK